MEAQGAQGFLPMLISFFPFIIVFFIMYMLIIRPQQKKQRKLREQIESLKKGDNVITTGGLIGKISGLKDDRAVLKIAENVKVEVLKEAITTVEK